MHWVQCNVYMLGVGYTSCLYYAVNKNDDAVYTEIVKLDVELAEMYVERGQRIAMQDELPEPMTKNKTWWECKFCKYHGFCHDDGKITNKSCRTCRYSTACEDSTWYCEKHNGELDETAQEYGCDSWELHDHLVK